MKRILLVDDDPLILRVYREALSSLGMQVETAQDGLAALKALQQIKPDLMVLDLVMPKLSGVDVLKFVRNTPAFVNLPVIVLSNSYAEEVAREAASIGAQKGLLKITCDPTMLAGVIGELLDGQPNTQLGAQLLGVLEPPRAPKPQAAPPPPAISPPAPGAPRARPAQQSLVSIRAPGMSADPEIREKAHAEFLQKAAETSAALRTQLHSLQTATTERERAARLLDLRRRFEFLAPTAETAGCVRIARMAGALDALLLGMMDQPSRVTPSALNTTSHAIEFVISLLKDRHDTPETALRQPRVVVVDDDHLSNRLVVSALRAVQINARSVNDPVAGLDLLAAKAYDLVVLDVEMPGMDGISFCRRLRTLAGYQTTPVVFVTLHTDAETRARTIDSGGNDFISKPISPQELTVKVLMHWLGRLEQAGHAIA